MKRNSFILSVLMAATCAGGVFGAVNVRLAAGGCYQTFVPGETPAVTLTVENGDADAREVSLAYRVCDYFGTVVARSTDTVAVKGKEKVTRVLTYPDLKGLGFFCVVADWKAGAASGTAEGSFVKVDACPARPDRLFGISVFAPNLPDLYSRIGVGTKSVTFDWRSLEDPKRPGEFDFSALRKQVDALRQKGIRVGGHFPTVETSRVPLRYLKKGVPKKEDPVADQAAFYAGMDNFVRKAVAAFSDVIKEWSASGEIDILLGTGKYVRQRYIDMVKVTSRAIRATDPTAKYLALGCAGGDGRANPRYPCLRSLLPSIVDDIDGFAIDQYTDGTSYGPGYTLLNSEQTGLREIMQEAVRIAKANGKSIVAIDEKGPCIIRQTPIVSGLGVKMANMVARDFITLKTVPEVKHWLYFRPFNWSPTSVMDWGMWEGTNPRQVVSAYAATARMMAHAEFVRGKPVHGDIPCWIFRKDGRTLATLWYNGKEPLKFGFASTKGLTAYDVQGNGIDLSKGEIVLAESPVYLVADAEKEIDRALDGARYDVPQFEAVLDHAAGGTVNVAVRNLSGKAISVRVAGIASNGKDRAVPVPPIEVKPFGLAVCNLGAVGPDETVRLQCGRAAEVRLAGLARPYRVRKIARWEDLAGSEEVVLEDPMRQAPSYADLHSNGVYDGLEDLSVRARFGYDDEALWIEARVRDDFHRNMQQPSRIFVGDCLQYGIDTLGNGVVDRLMGKRGWADDDYNIVSALADGKNVTFCYGAAAANRARMQNKELAPPEIVRDETAKVTRYRIRIPFRDLAPLKSVRGTVFGLSFLAFDMDRASGYYFIQSTPGVSEPVDPAQYLKFTLD